MKHKLFKKFATRDYNDYYYAVINGEIYYGVATRYEYDVKFLGMKFHRTEEQAFHTVKLPIMIVTYLTKYLEQENFDFDECSVEIEDSLIKELAEAETKMIEEKPYDVERIRQAYRLQYETVRNMFFLSWDVEQRFVERGWAQIYVEYTGKATRNIWYARAVEDLVTINMIKVFGNENDNELVEFKRLLLDKELIKELIEKITL